MKKRSLFLLDCEIEDVVDQEIDDLLMAAVDEPGEEPNKLHTILVYALSRIDVARTIRVIGFIKRLPILVLIDCENIHNFISEPIAKRLGLSIIDATPFSMGIANENQMTNARIC